MAGGTGISGAMAGDARITPIHRKQYQDSVIELMSINTGGQLRDWCIVQNCQGNTSTIFNTLEGTEISRTGDFNEGRFVTGENKESENNDFQFNTIEVAPKPIYAGNWIHETQYDQTMINIDGSVSKIQVTALGVEEDKDIIEAVNAVKVDAANKFGDASTALSLKTFTEMIDIARMFLGTGVRIAILANKADVARLRTDAGFAALSSDYAQFFGVQKAGTDDIATGKIITWRHDLIASGKMLIIADKVFGLATWNDTIGTSISYKDEKSKYFLKAWTSLGVANLDPMGVFVYEFTPIANARLAKAKVTPSK